MKEKPERLYIILYRAFYVALLFGICLTAFGRYFGITETDMLDVLFALLVLCGLLGISFLQLRGKAVSCILLLGILLMIPVVTGVEEGFWSCYGQWLFRQEGWEEAYIPGYELMQGCLVMAGCYPVQLLLEKMPVLKDIFGGAMLGYLLFVMIQKSAISHMAVCLMLGYAVLCFVEWTQKHWNKKKGKDYREYILRILPFIILLSGCMYFIPVPEDPYDWKFVKDVYQNIYEKVVIWFQDVKRDGQEDFGMAQVGFSEEGKLMRGVIPNDRLLLSLQGSMGLRTNVYLTGKSYDSFDGKKWNSSVIEDTDTYFMDTLETLYAVMRYDKERMEDYVYSTGLSVEYEYINTGYLFVPLKAKSIEGCEYEQRGSNLVFGEQRGYGTKYNLVYYQLNIDHPEFYTMAETALPDDNGLWKEALRTYGAEHAGGLTLSDLAEYRKSIKDRYCGDIRISPETQEYLDEITEGKETDIEKLQAIEKELLSFTYSTQLEKLPDSIDSEGEFLEYFLLEGREGYCSYFATAFVLMARAEGIPARYAEGFCIPKTADKYMTVTSGMAHAWPEVYLEGIGWIPFEPTPGYENIRYTPWKIKSETEVISTGDGGEILPEEDVIKEEESIEEEEPEAVEETNGQMDRKLLLMLGIVLVGTVLVLATDSLLFRRKYGRMSVEDKFLVQTKRLLWLLAQAGVSRKEEETLEELGKRAERSLDTEISFHTLSAYEAHIYGDHEITEEMLQKAAEENQGLLMKMKQENPWHYYWILLRMNTVKLK